MIESITRPMVTASAVAVVCAMPARTVRYALALLPLLGDPGPPEKRRTIVAVVDVVRLAVVARLDDLGVSMPEAVGIVETAVDPYLFGLATCGIDTPPDFMLQRLNGLVIHVIPRPKGHDLFASCESVPPIRAAVALVVNVGMIASETVRCVAPPRHLPPTNGRTPAMESAL